MIPHSTNIMSYGTRFYTAFRMTQCLVVVLVRRGVLVCNREGCIPFDNFDRLSYLNYQGLSYRRELLSYLEDYLGDTGISSFHSALPPPYSP